MRVSRLLGAAAVIAVALPLVACSSSPESGQGGDGSASGTSGGFPIVVEHAYGESVIPEKPERVATVAWANHEVPLALGVVPVGMSKATWGDDDGDGVLPWVEDRLDELGAETPALFDETDGIDFEAVADTKPDVILAGYSGLTQEEYDMLSKIAPVVAYPKGVTPWGTSVEDMIAIDSKALGLEDEGQELIADLDAKSEAALDANPELREKKLMFAFMDPSDLSKIGFYTNHDTRPGFLVGLGMPSPKIIEEETEKNEAFYVETSAEDADRFSDVDVFVTYGDPEGKLVQQLQADPLLSKIPAIAAGDIVILEDSTPLAASANPSPLSIDWGIDDYFSLLNSTTKAN